MSFNTDCENIGFTGERTFRFFCVKKKVVFFLNHTKNTIAAKL